MNNKKFIRLTNSFQPELPDWIDEAGICSCFNNRAPKMPVEWKTDRPNKDGEYLVIFKNRASGKVSVQLDWFLTNFGFGFEEFCCYDLIAWAELPKKNRRRAI